MKALKIKAPVNSLDSAKLQIEAGADEIYLGLFSPEWFANLSFSHRGISSLPTDKAGCLQDAKDLVSIVEYAHERNVHVSFTANFFNLADTELNPVNRKTLAQGYLDYVAMGIDSGVDSVIIANLNQALLIKNAGLNIPLSASCLFMISNVEYINILRTLGITSFVLPHDTNFFEMEQIVNLCKQEEPRCEVGVFGHFSCAMHSGGCHWYHKFGESIDIGYPCRNSYRVIAKGKADEELSIFNFNSNCSICQLSEIYRIGIDSIKVVGRASSPKLVAKIVAVYRRAVDRVMQGDDIREIRSEMIKNEPWWAVMHCKNDDCKYAPNNIFNKYAIG